MRPSLASAIILAAILLLLWRPWISDGEPSARPDPPSPERGSAGPPRPAPSPGLPSAPHVDTKRSPLADALNAADRTIEDDLRTVQELLTQYRSLFRANPTGSNREITHALSGGNPRLFAPLPRDHPAINQHGDLVDRWETPFFFHNLSGQFMEVRSAGLDCKLWTGDDVMLSNAPPTPDS